MSRSRRHRGNPVHGIVILDKPLGISSNAALQQVKSIFQAAKAGHTGSLDPLATGVLPICLGEATKLSAYLLESEKSYIATGRLGQATATGDAEGEITQEMPVPTLSKALIESVLEQFLGEITQIPPMHSAVKHKGKSLYKLARKGIEVERKPRNATIYKLELLEFTENSLRIEVHCSSGTYIRTLIEDIGGKLDTCAYLTSLRRISVGHFDLNESFSIDALQALAEESAEKLKQALLHPQRAVEHWSSVKLPKESVFYIKQGRLVEAPAEAQRGRVTLFSEENQFLGLGEVLEDGHVAPKRLFNLI